MKNPRELYGIYTTIFDRGAHIDTTRERRWLVCHYNEIFSLRYGGTYIFYLN
jgi:hypothetical protein